MKKLVYLLIALVSILLVLGLWCSYKRAHCPKDDVFKIKYLGADSVWLYDSACYKESGIYLRIYRKYNYEYTDSIEYYKNISDYTLLRYATSYRGDVVFMEYIDLTNYPHRED